MFLLLRACFIILPRAQETFGSHIEDPFAQTASDTLSRIFRLVSRTFDEEHSAQREDPYNKGKTPYMVIEDNGF